MMDIKVRSRHIDLPDGLREAVTEKVEHLGKFLSTISSIEVEFEPDGARGEHPVVAHLTVWTSGPVFRTRATATDPRSALDEAFEHASRRLKDFKRKRSGKPPHAHPAPAGAGPEVESLDLGIPQSPPPGGQAD